MDKTPLRIIAVNNDPNAQDLSIQFEPSVSMLTSMANLFRTQGQYRQATEISRLGVEYYPYRLEMRLLSAICQLDLGEEDAALREMGSLAGEIRPLAPGLKEMGELARRKGLGDLAEWSVLLAQILEKYPEGPQPNEESPVREEAEISTDSLVVPTLKKWLAQLQNQDPA